jgi:hypothetical protein
MRGTDLRRKDTPVERVTKSKCELLLSNSVSKCLKAVKKIEIKIIKKAQVRTTEHYTWAVAHLLMPLIILHLSSMERKKSSREISLGKCIEQIL